MDSRLWPCPPCGEIREFIQPSASTATPPKAATVPNGPAPTAAPLSSSAAAAGSPTSCAFVTPPDRSIPWQSGGAARPRP